MIISTQQKLIIPMMTYLLLSVGMSVSYAQKKNKKKEPVHAAYHQQAHIADAYFMEGIKYALTEHYDKAIVSFEQVVRMEPKNAAAHYKLAEILLQEGTFNRAIEHSQQAVSLDKSNEWYYMLLAESQLRSGNPNEAAATVETMLSKTTASPQNYLKLAQLYLQLNEESKALTALSKAEKAMGVDEEIVALKQRLYLSGNKITEALAEGEKLIAHFPEQNEYKLRQAQLLLNLQRQAEAQQYLLSYLESNPNDAHALFMLAKTYESQQQWEKSNQALLQAFVNPALGIEAKLQEMAKLIGHLPDEKLEQTLHQLSGAMIEAHPEDARAYAIAGDLLIATNQKKRARRAYRRALDFDESNFSVWQNSISLGLELGLYDSVAREAEQALSLFPNQAALYYFSGSANLSLNNYDEAAQILEHGKRLATSNKQLESIFNTHLGDAYNGLKNYSKSDAAFEAALAYNPNNAYILNNYSYYLSLRKEKLPLALSMSKKLLEQQPENPSYLDTHAWVLYQMKQYDKALGFLEKALNKSTNSDGTILEHYGDVLYQLGRKEEAVVQWKKAKTKENASDLIDKKIQEKKLYE